MRNPELYMHILMDNPNNKPLLKKFITETKNQLKTIENKDSKEFLKEFQMSKDFISPNKTKLKFLSWEIFLTRNEWGTHKKNLFL